MFQKGANAFADSFDQLFSIIILQTKPGAMSERVLSLEMKGVKTELLQQVGMRACSIV